MSTGLGSLLASDLVAYGSRHGGGDLVDVIVRALVYALAFRAVHGLPVGAAGAALVLVAVVALGRRRRVRR